MAISICACSSGWAEDIVFQTESFRAELGADAVWQALVESTTGRALLATDRKTPIASLQIDGKTLSANSARREGDRLFLGFGGADTEIEFAVEEAEHWVTFRLERIAGRRPEKVTFLRIGVHLAGRVGRRLNGTWDGKTAAVVRGANRQTQCQPVQRAGSTELTASCQDAPGPRLEGSAATLLAVPTPELKAILAKHADAYGLPVNRTAGGVASRDTDMARGSYWFLSFAEDEVDRVIEYCRETGFRQVMINSGAWCRSSGHYLFDTDRYPDGVESLRRTVERLHEEGILAGMHCFASKVSKRDPYVTPVPDRRFLADRTALLAEDISADSTKIQTANDLSQWPGSPAAKQKVWEGTVEKHQEVIIDDEIIRYESIGPEGKWDTFLGCRRGAWQTPAAAHKAKTECRHFAVDGCIDGYLIDQETGLLDEVTGRLAEIFNTCGFDMVYFDGCEDVDRRRLDYYAANFQAVAMSKFRKRPLIHKGGGFHHDLWHSFTSSATIDQYPGTYRAFLRDGGAMEKWPTCKDHIDRTAERVAACRDDMIPGELGWFGLNPADGEYDGLQYDEVEYLLCKSMALDAPISLQTSFAAMEQHPLTGDILALIRRYEALRHHQYGRAPIAGLKRFSREDLARLETPGRDFFIDTRLGDAPAAVEMSRVAFPDDDVRLFLGSAGDARILKSWHARGRDGTLVLDAKRLPDSFVVTEVARENGSESTARLLPDDGRMAIPLDHRYREFDFRGVSPEALRKALESAEFAVRPPQRLWIQAEDFAACQGAMVRGSASGARDADAIGDFVVCAGKIDRSPSSPSYCEYRVVIPRKGVWTLWARVRYPSGGDMSFGFAPAGEAVTLSGDQVIGNCGVNEARWHWTGRGGGVTTVPPGSPVRLPLEAGEFRFRIYPREGSGAAGSNPRLDVMCLCEDPADLPSDAEARAHFGPNRIEKRSRAPE